MKEITISEQLLKEDLFKLFKDQLRKDFESSAMDATFIAILPSKFDQLKSRLAAALKPITSGNSSLLPTLLYRVDISETQVLKAQEENFNLGFEELLAELIIKRVLQKVVLKRKYSQNK